MSLSYGFLLVAIIAMFPVYVQGQSDSRNPDRFLEFRFTNDFVFESDRYFTNGLDLAYYSPGLNNDFTRLLLWTGKKNSNDWYALTFTQHFFTPANLFSIEAVTGDRPFASYLLIGIQKISLRPQELLRIESQLQIGLLGRYSGGQSIQNGIHEILPASRPALGWDNQLSSDFAFNYRLRIEKGIIDQKKLALLPYSEVRIGIPYSDIKAGMHLRYGKFNKYFHYFGIDRNKNIELYIFADYSVRLVGYNATIQGGLFSESPQTISGVSRFVTDFKSGITFRYNRFSVEYEQHFISPEFRLGMPHKWAGITLRYAF